MRDDDSAISIEGCRAGIFDLDGVITDTASAHFWAWKRLFDDFLAGRDGQGDFTEEEYREYVDGKPRIDGIRCFLEAREIELPEETDTDEPSIASLAEAKNEHFHAQLREQGVEVFGDAVDFVRALREKGLRTAIVSSSKNCQIVLAHAGLEELFDERVDGNDLSDDLKGKPEPDMFIEAARRLSVEPSEAFVAEDAIAGVEAGRAGGFALVVGVARDGGGDALGEHGADIVIGEFR